ncbi:hypothetical protein CEXT_563501 [Caerostris extrusa]|uniref:Uncharacterized protein n=1 Tax=Caerostris extrusa TaxID=172846 RepID=A0AAV4N0C6_CAEEX|nr:hypothetical protein CEXT_563501 [Caerostris extrusa]
MGNDAKRPYFFHNISQAAFQSDTHQKLCIPTPQCNNSEPKIGARLHVCFVKSALCSRFPWLPCDYHKKSLQNRLIRAHPFHSIISVVCSTGQTYWSVRILNAAGLQEDGYLETGAVGHLRRKRTTKGDLSRACDEGFAIVGLILFQEM